MNIYRSWIVSSRYLSELPRNFNKLVSIIYWPFIDIAVVGLIALSYAAADQKICVTFYGLMAGVALWQLVVRANYAVCLNLLKEIEERNVANLFSTPLTIVEWTLSTIISSGIVTTIVGFYCIGIVYLLFGFNIFSLGLNLIPIFLFLIIFGISISLFTASFLIRWGLRVQVLVWTIAWLFAPFSCAYQPINVLPNYLQVVAKLFPTYYIFRNIRLIVCSGKASMELFIISFILTIFTLF